jgi:PIN domain nuclease of toxin-antitoxin system
MLDTHVFFWFVRSSPRLSAIHKQLIESRTGPVYVSAVTGWEIAVKVNLGKWPQAAPLLPGLSAAVTGAGLLTRDVTMAHAERAGSLPLLHRDPFDRFLATQSLMLDIPIATVDRALQLFGCKTV